MAIGTTNTIPKATHMDMQTEPPPAYSPMTGRLGNVLYWLCIAICFGILAIWAYGAVGIASKNTREVQGPDGQVYYFDAWTGDLAINCAMRYLLTPEERVTLTPCFDDLAPVHVVPRTTKMDFASIRESTQFLLLAIPVFAFGYATRYILTGRKRVW